MIIPIQTSRTYYQFLLQIRDDKIRQKLFHEAQRNHNNLTFQTNLEMAKRYETRRNKIQKKILADDILIYGKGNSIGGKET